MPRRLFPSRPTPPPKQPAAIYLEAALDASGWSEIAAADGGDDAQRIPKFSMVAYTGGIMRPRLSMAYDHGVVLDLRGWKFIAGQIPVNWQHNSFDPVGHCESTEIGTQVKASGLLSIPGESRDKITAGAANGYRWRVSVEGTPDYSKAEQIPAGETITVNGRRLRGPFLLLRAGTFSGIGFVTTAGDSAARASITAASFHPSSLGTDSDMTFEEFLIACGVDQATASQDQLATLHAAYNAQQGITGDTGSGAGTGSGSPIQAGLGGPAAPGQAAPQSPAPQSGAPLSAEARRAELQARIDEENELRAANAERVGRINELCAEAGEAAVITVDGNQVPLAAHAIRTGMSATEVELHLLRASAPRGPAIHSRSADEYRNSTAMIGAVLLASGIALDSPVFQDPAAIAMGLPAPLRASLNSDQRQRSLEAAHRYGSVNLLEMAKDAIYLDGGQPPRKREDLIQAAASSGNLTNVYRATVGAGLLQGYLEGARTLALWTGVDEVDDFKTFQRHREDLHEDLDYLPPNSEAAHSSIGAQYENVSVDSYAKQFEIGRHDYLNNNLGLIARQPVRMGQAAFRTEENLGYAALLANPTMNSTGRQLFNATDGTAKTSKPLNHANASALIADMMSQSIKGVPIDLMAKFALVPPQLHDTAIQVYRSAVIAEDSGQGVINAVATHGIKPISSSRLSNGVRHPKTGVFQAGSTTTHYLVAEGVDVAVRVYLRGSSRVPVLRVSQLTQGRWGTHFDVLHDVGFAFLSTRGIFRATA